MHSISLTVLLFIACQFGVTTAYGMQQDPPSLLKALQDQAEDATILALLESKTVNVNEQEDYGWTALHEAICQNRFVIAEALLKRGAFVNARSEAACLRGHNKNFGWLPIHEAAFRGNLEAVKLLTRYGALLYQHNHRGRTPQQEAGEHAAIVAFFRDDPFNLAYNQSLAARQSQEYRLAEMRYLASKTKSTK